jgi:hypothetical protein
LVDELSFLLEVVLPVVVEITIALDGAEFEDGFGAGEPPAGAGEVYSVLDQMATSAFDDAGGDRPAVGSMWRSGRSRHRGIDRPRHADAGAETVECKRRPGLVLHSSQIRSGRDSFGGRKPGGGDAAHDCFHFRALAKVTSAMATDQASARDAAGLLQRHVSDRAARTTAAIALPWLSTASQP